MEISKSQAFEIMSTSIVDRDLTKQAPHSPRERFGGYAILGRTIDKCRASMTGKLGEYHYDCPLDNQLFSFKGIDGADFKSLLVIAKTYEDVVAALESRGTRKSQKEINAWSDQMDALKVRDVAAKREPADREKLKESCEQLGLDFDTVCLFDWLDADDKATFRRQPGLVEK
jgi:hypothetical protein